MGEDVTMLHRDQVHTDGVLARDRDSRYPGEQIPHPRFPQADAGVLRYADLVGHATLPLEDTG